MPFTPWGGEQQPDVLLSPASPQGHKAGQAPQGPDKATIIRKATDKGLEPWKFSEERGEGRQTLEGKAMAVAAHRPCPEDFVSA